MDDGIRDRFHPPRIRLPFAASFAPYEGDPVDSESTRTVGR